MTWVVDPPELVLQFAHLMAQTRQLGGNTCVEADGFERVEQPDRSCRFIKTLADASNNQGIEVLARIRVGARTQAERAVPGLCPQVCSDGLV